MQNLYRPRALLLTRPMWRVGLCLLAVTALLPLPAHAERITLQQAVEDALGNSPEVLIARERVVQAKEAVKETRGELLPQMDISVETGREFNTPAGARERDETHGNYSTSYDATLGATQKLFDGARTRSEILRREGLLEGSNYRATAIRHKVAQQMVETFLNIYQNQQALASVNIFVGRLEDLSAKMDLYAQEGNASKTLQKYVSSRLANAKQVRVQLNNALQDSLESYTFLTQAPLDLSRTTLVMMSLPALEPFETYKQEAATNNPEMKSNLADLNAASAEYRKAKGSYYPMVNLNGEYSDNRNVGGKVGQVRGASAMVEMRYKIFDGFTRDATLRRMASQETEKKLQVERTRRKNDQSLKGAWQTLQAKLQEEKLIRDELADSMDVRNLRQQEFEEGAGDLVQLVETEEKLFAAARQKLNVDTAILLNRFTLEFLTGKPHLSGTAEYLPFNPFEQLKSYSELLEKKSQAAPALATAGNVSDTSHVSETIVTPVPKDIPETKAVSETAAVVPVEKPAVVAEVAVKEISASVTVVEKVENPVVKVEATEKSVKVVSATAEQQAPAVDAKTVEAEPHHKKLSSKKQAQVAPAAEPAKETAAAEPKHHGFFFHPKKETLPATEMPVAETPAKTAEPVKRVEVPAKTPVADEESGEQTVGMAVDPVQAAPDVTDTTAMDELLDGMTKIEPAAGDTGDTPYERVMSPEVDTPLEERGALFPDYYLAPKPKSALALPENFDDLPAPKR